MPNNLYCSSCGYPNVYTLSKPKFCGGCSKPLGAVNFANVAPAPKPIYQPEPAAPVPTNPRSIAAIRAARDRRRYEEEEEAIEEIPDIDGLSFGIEEFGNKVVTLEDAIFSNPKPMKDAESVKYRRVKKGFSKDTLSSVMSKAKSGTPREEIE